MVVVVVVVDVVTRFVNLTIEPHVPDPQAEPPLPFIINKSPELLNARPCGECNPLLSTVLEVGDDSSTTFKIDPPLSTAAVGLFWIATYRLLSGPQTTAEG